VLPAGLYKLSLFLEGGGRGGVKWWGVNHVRALFCENRNLPGHPDGSVSRWRDLCLTFSRICSTFALPAAAAALAWPGAGSTALFAGRVLFMGTLSSRHERLPFVYPPSPGRGPADPLWKDLQLPRDCRGGRFAAILAGCRAGSESKPPSPANPLPPGYPQRRASWRFQWSAGLERDALEAGKPNLVNPGKA